MLALLGFAGLVVVGVLVHIAFFGRHAAPVGRVELNPRQRVVLVSLFALPIALGALITVFGRRIFPGISSHTWTGTLFWLAGFAVAVAIGVAPRDEDDDD